MRPQLLPLGDWPTFSFLSSMMFICLVDCCHRWSLLGFYFLACCTYSMSKGLLEPLCRDRNLWARLELWFSRNSFPFTSISLDTRTSRTYQPPRRQALSNTSSIPGWRDIIWFEMRVLRSSLVSQIDPFQPRTRARAKLMKACVGSFKAASSRGGSAFGAIS